VGNGWLKNLFESKGKNMKEVAVKVAELDEDEKINIWGLDFSPDGKYLAATSPNTVSMSSNKVEVQIWDWQNKRIVHRLELVPGANTDLTTESIRYSPDGQLLAVCHSRPGGSSDGNVIIRVWNTKTWEVAHDITDINYGSCSAISFTSDGKSLVGVLFRLGVHPGDNLVIYDTTTWQSVWGLRTAPYYPNALAISPDGKLAVIGGGAYDNEGKLSQQISIVDLTQHNIVRTISNPTGASQIAWSPDGRYFTISSGAGIKVFDVGLGKSVISESLNAGHTSIRYTPDGKYLLDADLGGLTGNLGIRIWDSQHRELLQEIAGNYRGLAVSRDGNYLAAGGYKQITVWKLQ
jgi:WD40 repeat protein